MLQSERDKLNHWSGVYLSIGISEDGTPYGQYPVPWNGTANAYNMKLPKVYISKKDLKDEELMEKICSFRVNGCYIFCPLENYDFLNRLRDMSDLNIYQAYHLQDLTFLANLEECRMMFISKAHLQNINWVAGVPPYFVSKPRCLALYDCVVDDLSFFENKRVLFNEIIICNPKNRDERARWKCIEGVRYYDMKE